MAEEQKIVFELRDSSGASTGTASAPSPQAGSIPPGSQVAQEFQQQVSAGGADRVAGRGSAPASSYATTQTPSVASSGDPLLAATRQIFSADPRTTANELQQALGIEAGRAQALIDGLYSTSQTASPLAQPSPSRQPSTTNSVDDLIRGMPQYPQNSTESLVQGVRESMASEAEDRANTTRQREAETNRRIQELGGIEEPSPFNSSYDPFHVENRAVGEGDLEAAGRMVQSARGLNTQSNSSAPSEAVDLSGVNTLLHTGAGIANQFGVPGRVVSTAINAIGAAMAVPSVAEAAAPLALALAPLAAPVAAVAAAIAVPTAAGYAMVNEAERAKSIVGNYSPDAAQANAMAQVMQLMANLRTADTLGDEVAGYTTARARVDSATQNIRDTISEPALQSLNSSMRLVATNLETVSALLSVGQGTRLGDALKVTPIQGLELLMNKLGYKTQAELDAMNTPFAWFKAQPHLGNPEGMGTPVRGFVAPTAGLSF